MKLEGPASKREFPLQKLDCDLVVAGGGLAGACCAITAARAGLRVVLVQDRPVLGGNASSEVRLWVLGATSHMGNNNRWSREGGVVDEILVENLYRNPEGNALVFDTVLMEKVVQEKNIRLLLNTAVIDLGKSSPDSIQSLRAFCSQNSTMYEISAPLFCDATGDGAVGFLAGAAFRMGAESADEFGEKWAPDKAYGELLGQSLYFYSKDAGHPVSFTAPSYALQDITQIPRWRGFNTQEYGCRLWWIEYGGRLDPIHDTEAIKWELWKVVYGVWNHIKNSGQFPDAASLTLEWVGQIPGKRESRRFEGPYMLRQQDVVGQAQHADAVSFGGWSIDLHPADGVYSPEEGSSHCHAKGVYQIPYRTLFSRNIHNLFLAGRTVSSSHVAFGSTRVMATCAHSGQAVGMAAALCVRAGVKPADLDLALLQRHLLRRGQHIPGVPLKDPEDLAGQGALSASSELKLAELPADGPWQSLDKPRGQMLPLPAGRAPKLSVRVRAAKPGPLVLELRVSERLGNFSFEKVLATREASVPAGESDLALDFDVSLDQAQYALYCLKPIDGVEVRLSEQRLTGVLSLKLEWRQEGVTARGGDDMDFWLPERRPEGQNFAFRCEPALDLFGATHLANGFGRPSLGPNAWLADFKDKKPSVSVAWDAPREIGSVELAFDPDFDHAMESVLMGHPERAVPFCVKHYRLLDDKGAVLHECLDNHQSRQRIVFEKPVRISKLVLEVLASHGSVPASVFEFRCYEA